MSRGGQPEHGTAGHSSGHCCGGRGHLQGGDTAAGGAEEERGGGGAWGVGGEDEGPRDDW